MPPRLNGIALRSGSRVVRHRILINRFTPRRGAATVELALVLPLLVALFGALVDYSRCYRFSLTIAACARNGALYASDPGIEGKSPYDDVIAATKAGTESYPEALDVTTENFSDSQGNDCVRVTVTYPFETVLTYPGFPKRIELERSACMRIRKTTDP